MKRITSYIILALAAMLPFQAMAQNDKDAVVKALRPVIQKYQGRPIQMDSAKLFNKIFKKFKKDPHTLAQIASLFYSSENPDSAAAHRVEDRIIKMYPNFGYVYTVRGANAVSYYADHENGPAYMLKGIQMSPDDPQCLSPYVQYRLDRRRRPTHADSLEMRVMVDSLAARVKTDKDRMKVADIYALFNGGSLDASTVSRSLLSDVKYEKMTLVELKSVLANLVAAQDFERTQNVLDKALALYPKDSYIHRIALTHYNNMHEYTKAEEWAKVYFAEVPTDSLTPRDYRMYAACLDARGAYDEAVANLWKAYEVADKQMDANRAYKSKLVDAGMIIDIYKKLAEDELAAGNIEKGVEIHRKSIDEFMAHNDHHQVRNSYYEIAELYQKSAETLTGDAKAEAYIKAREVYKEIEDVVETTQANKDKCYYSQWLMTYNACIANRDKYIEERTNYSKEIIERALAYDKANNTYLENPLVFIFNSNNPEELPQYVDRIYAKFPEYVNLKIDDLMDKLPKKIQYKYQNEAREAGMSYSEWLSANGKVDPVEAAEGKVNGNNTTTTTTTTKSTKQKKRK